MKRVWEIFKEYYLISLIVNLILFLAFLISAVEDENYLFAFTLTGLFVLLFLILDTIRYFKCEYLRPKQIKKELNSDAFLIFKRNGFRLVKNELIGQIRKYPVSIVIEWENYQKKSNYQFKVLFDPLSLGRHLSFEEYIKFNDIEKNEFYVSLNYVEKSHTKKEFSRYKFKEPLEEINKMIDYLIIKKLNPLIYREWTKTNFEIKKIEDDYLNKI